MRLSILICCLTILGIGCGSQQLLQPVPWDQRIDVQILSIVDGTGSYADVKSSFDSLAAVALNDGYIDSVKPGSASPAEFPQQLTYPNPFRRHSDGGGGPGYYLRATLERVEYGSAENLRTLLTSLWLFGTPNIFFFRINKDEMVGLAQYRLHVYADTTARPVSTFMITGIFQGDKDQYSRASILRLANIHAAYLLKLRLLEHLRHQELSDLPHVRKDVTPKDIRRIIYQLEED